MRRSKMQIMLDILNIVRQSEKTKTSIVYGANLNFDRADHYLEMMMELGLVEKFSNKYVITELGGDYRQKLNELSEVLKYEKF